MEVNGSFRKKVEEEAHQIQENANETVASSSITRGFSKKVEESANKSEEEEAHQVQEAAVMEYDPFVAKEVAAEESQFAVAGVSTIASEHSSIDESLSSSMSNGHVAVESATLGTQAPEEQMVMENGFSQYGQCLCWLIVYLYGLKLNGPISGTCIRCLAFEVSPSSGQIVRFGSGLQSDLSGSDGRG